MAFRAHGGRGGAAGRYTGNGILGMLKRNRAIKPCPERFQDSPAEFDVIVTCENRVYELVLAALDARGMQSHRTVHIVNFDIRDNHESALVGAQHICDLCVKVAWLYACGPLRGLVGRVCCDFRRCLPRPLACSVTPILFHYSWSNAPCSMTKQQPSRQLQRPSWGSPCCTPSCSTR